MFSRDDFSLRGPVLKESELILKWRNSSRIRASSFHKNIISWEEHSAWFEKELERGSLGLRIFEYRAEPIGVMRFITDASANLFWSFYLGQEGLAKGIGTVLGYLGLQRGFEELRVSKIYGDVLVDNENSHFFHKKLGFIPLEKKTQDHFLRYVITSSQWSAIRPAIERRVFSDK